MSVFGEVCLPYEFTLLSNKRHLKRTKKYVCLPYEFTLLSNLKSRSSHQVNIPLQYGQILYGFFIMANFHQKHKRPYQ